MELGGRGVRGIVIRNEEKIWRGNCREHYPFAKVTFQSPESVKKLTTTPPLLLLCSLHKKFFKLPYSFVQFSQTLKNLQKGLAICFFLWYNVRAVNHCIPLSLLSRCFSRLVKVEEEKTASLCGLSKTLLGSDK